MGLSAGFCLLGHFHGLIPSACGIYSGRWVVVVGRWAVLWVFRQFCGSSGSFVGLQAVLWGFSWTVSRNPRVAFAWGG